MKNGSKVCGVAEIQRDGLYSFLKSQLKKYNINLTENPKPSCEFSITDIPSPNRSQSDQPLKYAIVFKESLREKLSLLEQEYAAIFKFPFMVEEVAKTILTHIKLFSQRKATPLTLREHNVNYTTKLPKGVKIYQSNAGLDYLMVYKNKFVKLTPAEKEFITRLLTYGVCRHDFLNSRAPITNGKRGTLAKLAWSVRQKFKKLKLNFTLKNMYGYGYFLEKETN